ncbi:MAG TPA: pilus assembly protein N-terminal domain-containing protein [Xanthobacteraceae bacterium]|nr:pilus assembly protein N-terminal domain-containing protein [Xanthobacteraceae bacterium]
MKSNLDRRGLGNTARAGALVLLAAVAILPRPALAAEAPLNIVLDQATIMRLPEKVSTIVVGNPLIADIAIQSGGLIVVTGKGFGATNLIVLDRAGAVLMERQVVVRGATDQTVSVYRGAERETYSCTPNCERRITLGDSAAFFTAVSAQTDARNAQSSVAGTKQSR